MHKRNVMYNLEEDKERVTKAKHVISLLGKYPRTKKHMETTWTRMFIVA